MKIRVSRLDAEFAKRTSTMAAPRECERCYQFESADGAVEDMGRAPIVEKHPVVIVRRERGEWSAAPRGDT